MRNEPGVDPKSVLELLKADLDRRDLRSLLPFIPIVLAVVSLFKFGFSSLRPLLDNRQYLLFALSVGCFLYLVGQQGVDKILNSIHPRSVTAEHPEYSATRQKMSEASDIYMSARTGGTIWTVAWLLMAFSWVLSALALSRGILWALGSAIALVAVSALQRHPDWRATLRAWRDTFLPTATPQRVAVWVKQRRLWKRAATLRQAPPFVWVQRYVPGWAAVIFTGISIGLVIGVMNWWELLAPQGVHSAGAVLAVGLGILLILTIGISADAAWTLATDATRPLLSQLRVGLIESRIDAATAMRLYVAIEILRWDRSRAFTTIESLRAAIDTKTLIPGESSKVSYSEIQHN